MKYLALIIGIILVIPVYGQRKKKDDEVVVAPTFTEGVVYSLPRTGIRVHVKALKEDFKPGPYASYAEQLLGINGVQDRAKTTWTITEVKIETFAEPDPAQVHKAMGEGAFLVSLTSDGCLAGINSGATNLPEKQVKTNKVIPKPEAKDDFSFDYFTDTPLYETGDSTNNFKPRKVNKDQKAAEAAKRILESRLNRYDVAAGMMDDPYPDGDAYEISLAELKKIEKNYLSLFVGRTTYVKDLFSFDYVPSKLSGKGDVIFRISDDKGVVPASDLSGKPVMIEFNVEKSLLDKYTELAKSENKDAGESGIYYRMPALANVNVVNELSILSSARVTMAQFGVIAPVPEEMLYGDYQIKFHPETGAIQSVEKK